VLNSAQGVTPSASALVGHRTTRLVGPSPRIVDAHRPKLTNQ
jgi:hypothetical protein